MSIFFYPRRRGRRGERSVDLKGLVRPSYLQQSREGDGDHLPCFSHSQLTNETNTSEGPLFVAIYIPEASDASYCLQLNFLDSFLHPSIQIFLLKKRFHPHAGFLAEAWFH